MPMNATMTLANLTIRTGLEVLSHLERQIVIPVIDGLQAQGDLIVIPQMNLPDVLPGHKPRWQLVPATGTEILRSSAGGNPHTLIADPGTCRWTTTVLDRTGLALGMLETSSPAYLLHPEHGASGIAPGTYIIRRQRERNSTHEHHARYVAD
jgi:hypothetical protein